MDLTPLDQNREDVTPFGNLPLPKPHRREIQGRRPAPKQTRARPKASVSSVVAPAILERTAPLTEMDILPKSKGNGLVPMGFPFATGITHPSPARGRGAPSNMSARGVVAVTTMPKTTRNPSLFPIVTPFVSKRWRELLLAAGTLDQFHDVPKGIAVGFDLGVSSTISAVFMPKNHTSALSNPDIVDAYIAKEINAGRFSAPYEPDELERVAGPFRTGPLGVVFNITHKPRVVLDHSYPRDDAFIQSVNSEIDNSEFQCDWTTFMVNFMLVCDAPPGTEVAVRDVDAAHRRMPTAPSDRLHVCVHWRGKVHIDHCCCFGCSSSSGIFGRAADAARSIFIYNGVDDARNWADDFNFWRYPIISSSTGPWTYRYNEKVIDDTAVYIGLPWSVEKSKPFARVWEFIGFVWNLIDKTVYLSEAKKAKFLAKLEGWTSGASFSQKQIASVIGTLNHCAPVILGSRTRLPAFYRYAGRFRPTDPPFRRLPIPKDVVAESLWWTNEFQKDFCGMVIKPRPAPCTVVVYVDASTSWGIGLVVDGRWMAWKLKPGWKSDGRDIGWAEIVAIELALLVLISLGYSSLHFIIHSDNQGVVGAFRAGMSRSVQQNAVLRRILMLLNEHKMWFSTTWVCSEDNIADGPSRGLFPSASSALDVEISIPFALRRLVCDRYII